MKDSVKNIHKLPIRKEIASQMRAWREKGYKQGKAVIDYNAKNKAELAKKGIFPGMKGYSTAFVIPMGEWATDADTPQGRAWKSGHARAKREATREATRRQSSGLRLVEGSGWDEGQHPRDPDGKWTDK